MRHLLTPGGHLIGRDPACRIVIDCPDVSHRHAVFEVQGDAVFLEDLGSINGTYVDGAKIAGRVRLLAWQRVGVGSAVLELRPGVAPGPESTAASRLEPGPAELTELQARGPRYRAGALVAQGGMGAILDAHDMRLRRVVAMKRLKAGARASRESLLRFLQEARVLGQLEHPNIVPIHDLDLTEHGEPFYTMKFVKGVTLHRILQDIKAGKPEAIARYPLNHLLTIFQKLCDAVSFAHSRRVIHRDLKPENVMVGDFGEVLVMDWGLAKILGERGEEALPEGFEEKEEPVLESGLHTMEGRVMGTPHYMAPEQAEGRVGDIDERTDIFALGGILYAILTFEPPVNGATPAEVLERIRAGEIVPPSTYNTTQNRPRAARSPAQPAGGVFAHCPNQRIPDALSAVAMKALALDPAARYRSVIDLQMDVGAYQGGYATSAERAGAWTLLKLAMWRRRTEFMIAGAAVGLIAILTFVSLWQITGTLGRLRSTAPQFIREAESLADQHQFVAALRQVDLALELAPRNQEFHRHRGDLLQALLRLEDAAAAYERAARLAPTDERARANRDLCRKWLAAAGGHTNVPMEGIKEIRQQMVQERRSAQAAALGAMVVDTLQGQLEDLQARLAQRGFKGLVQLWAGRVMILHDPEGSLDDLAPLAGLPFGEIVIAKSKIASLEPLRGMALRKLQLHGAPIRDLEPLRGMPLELLWLTFSQVSDLSPLKGMRLSELNLHGTTNVTDLSPLRGMPLTTLTLKETGVSDLVPLRGMPLRGLFLGGCRRVADLEPLRGMPLEYLELQDCLVEDLSPIAKAKLQVLRAWDCRQIKTFTVLRGMPISCLELVNTAFDDPSILVGMPLSTLNLLGTQIRTLEPLRGMRLKDLLFDGTKVSDLSPLRGMALTSLGANETEVEDLSPLAGMPLTWLRLSMTRVGNLDALKGMPLTVLHAGRTRITNISVLAQMPLKELNLEYCGLLRDVSPLASCTLLERLAIPAEAENIDFLRRLPKLTNLAFARAHRDDWTTPAAEFWKAYDARRSPAPQSGR